MPTSRLYATLIVMGASLTGTTGIAIVAATVPACSANGHLALIDIQLPLIDSGTDYIDLQFPLIDIAFAPDLADGSSTPTDMGADLEEQD